MDVEIYGTETKTIHLELSFHRILPPMKRAACSDKSSATFWLLRSTILPTAAAMPWRP